MFRQFISLFIFVAAMAHGSINWTTDYAGALEQSKASSKPIVLFFTGSDWCGWCHKLEGEALDTSDFEREAGDAFIFVKLDYPRKGNLSSQEKSQNDRLKQKFQVKSFPTLIVIDSQENAIGVTGYKSGGGSQYAKHLKTMVGDYATYQEKLHPKN